MIVVLLITLNNFNNQALLVYAWASKQMLVTDAMYMNTSISCDFTSSNQCGYWSFNDHDLYKWQLTYKDTLTYGIHSLCTSIVISTLSLDILLIVGYVNKFFKLIFTEFFICFL